MSDATTHDDLPKTTINHRKSMLHSAYWIGAYLMLFHIVLPWIFTLRGPTIYSRPYDVSYIHWMVWAFIAMWSKDALWAAIQIRLEAKPLAKGSWRYRRSLLASVLGGVFMSSMLYGTLYWLMGINVNHALYKGPPAFPGLRAPTQNIWLNTEDFLPVVDLEAAIVFEAKLPEHLAEVGHSEPCTFRLFINEWGHTVDARPIHCDERLQGPARDAAMHWWWGGKSRGWKHHQTVVDVHFNAECRLSDSW